MNSACCVFFFQAEDGIRDLYVTGVQTCALPISDIVQPRSDRVRIAHLTLGGLQKQSFVARSEEHTSELQSRRDLVCRLLLEKKKVATTTRPGSEAASPPKRATNPPGTDRAPTTA